MTVCKPLQLLISEETTSTYLSAPGESHYSVIVKHGPSKRAILNVLGVAKYRTRSALPTFRVVDEDTLNGYTYLGSEEDTVGVRRDAPHYSDVLRALGVPVLQCDLCGCDLHAPEDGRGCLCEKCVELAEAAYHDEAVDIDADDFDDCCPGWCVSWIEHERAHIERCDTCKTHKNDGAALQHARRSVMHYALKQALYWLEAEATSPSPGSTKPDEILRVLRAALGRPD